MAKLKLVAVSLSAALLLSACASTPEECDPSQDQGFFGKMGCVVTGSYDARVQAKQQNVDKLQSEIESINQMTRDIHAKHRALMGDYFARQKVLDQTTEDLYNLERKLAQKKALSVDLQERIDKAQQQVATMNTRASASQSIAQKEKQIDELRAQLDALYSGLNDIQLTPCIVISKGSAFFSGAFFCLLYAILFGLNLYIGLVSF